VALPRPFQILRTEQQWLLAAHQNTALEGEVVELAFSSGDSGCAASDPGIAAGLAFDAYCRLYRSEPGEGQVERVLWRAADPLCPTKDQPTPLDLFATPKARVGEFHLAGDTHALQEPLGLAVDSGGRLFVAEAEARRVLVYDLWSRRLLRKVPLAGRPLDLAANGRTVWAVTSDPAGLLRMDARTGPRSQPLPAGITAPGRIAIAPQGDVWLLDHPRTPDARVLPLARPSQGFAVPFATDIEFMPGSSDAETLLVAARSPGQDFLRFRITVDSVEQIGALTGRRYDGLGIVRTPDGRIGFWTALGFRNAVAARRVYAPSGRVTTFRLDSGDFGTVWGRLFLDACIPRETSVTVYFATADEPPDEATLPRTPPANVISVVISRPDLAPPMPPLSLVPGAEEIGRPLHERKTGRELPWARMAADDPFETYEAPIDAPPGRFLWVTLQLAGNTRFTPRVRCLRAEYPTHDLMRRLPKLYSRDARSLAFLRRYLAMFDGTLGELEGKADARDALIDPRSAPEEVLPWLGSFVGLVMDEPWPAAVRRQLLEEAISLFRFRGTVPELTRFLEIYLGVRPILIESFRLRGLESPTPVVGAGFRVGGAQGADAYQTHAHRFAVVIPRELSSEELQEVQRILDVHRPAHTIVEVCTVAAGMRLGRGLRAGLTSIIGPSGAFVPLQAGVTSIGRNAVIGRPQAGTVPGESRIGRDDRVG
jgi:phage tail-like protein